MDLLALREFGWTSADVRDDAALVELARSLGPLANDGAISHLRPKDCGSATSRSFSYRFGLDRFPMHSDTAYWPLPARYIVLRASAATPTDTLLLPRPQLTQLMISNHAHRAIFSIRTTTGGYYGRAYSGLSASAIRFDPCYMRSANCAARTLSQALSFPSPEDIHTFSWTGCNALVIDNWACLHGRASVVSGDTGRIISRLYVTQE